MSRLLCMTADLYPLGSIELSSDSALSPVSSSLAGTRLLFLATFYKSSFNLILSKQNSLMKHVY